MEAVLDSAVESGVSFVKRYRQVLVAAALGIAALFYSSLVAYVNSSVVLPIQRTVAHGLLPSQLASAVALGLVSGLSAPGLTMAALALCARVASALSFDSDASVLAIAAALNVALTLPDLIVWNRFYSPIGATMLPGGKYVRPFVAGTIPWALSAPPLFLATYTLVLPVAKLIL